MTVQASQGHEPGDTPSKELDRLIGAAADAARVLVGSRPSDRANWLDLVESVTYAQHHGGPYPATTSIQTTSVGTAAIDRFLRPVTYQDAPDDVLPPPLQEDNPWQLTRRVDGILQQV